MKAALSWAVVILDCQSMDTILEQVERHDGLMERLAEDDELMITLTDENNQRGACTLFR